MGNIRFWSLRASGGIGSSVIAVCPPGRSEPQILEDDGADLGKLDAGSHDRINMHGGRQTEGMEPGGGILGWISRTRRLHVDSELEGRITENDCALGEGEIRKAETMTSTRHSRPCIAKRINFLMRWGAIAFFVWLILKG